MAQTELVQNTTSWASKTSIRTILPLKDFPTVAQLKREPYL